MPPLLGLVFSKLMRCTHTRGYIDRESFVAQYLALTVFTVGVTTTLGSDDLLAAFAAGASCLTHPIPPNLMNIWDLPCRKF